VSVDTLTDQLVVFAKSVMKSASGDTFQVAADLDLSFSQLRAMFVLTNAPTAPALHELAAIIGLSVAATGRAVDGLVRNELVTRTEDAADRRVKRLAVTERGRDAIERINTSRRHGLARFVEALGEDERTRLSEALTPLLDRAAAELCAPAAQTSPAEEARS
jgi:DNA-binding MarR family transcriptional regulator